MHSTGCKHSTQHERAPCGAASNNRTKRKAKWRRGRAGRSAAGCCEHTVHGRMAAAACWSQQGSAPPAERVRALPHARRLPTHLKQMVPCIASCVVMNSPVLTNCGVTTATHQAPVSSKRRRSVSNACWLCRTAVTPVLHAIATALCRATLPHLEGQEGGEDVKPGRAAGAAVGRVTQPHLPAAVEEERRPGGDDAQRDGHALDVVARRPAHSSACMPAAAGCERAARACGC